MQNESSGPQIIRFGTFELDVRAGELRNRGAKIKLQEQPRRILEMLLAIPGSSSPVRSCEANSGRRIPFVDFDHGLNKAVNKLREALLRTLLKSASLHRDGAQTRLSVLQPITNAVPEASIAVRIPESHERSRKRSCSPTVYAKRLFSVSRKSETVGGRADLLVFLQRKSVDLRTVGQQLNVRTLLEAASAGPVTGVVSQPSSSMRRMATIFGPANMTAS
jgi:hypothetical protein